MKERKRKEKKKSLSCPDEEENASLCRRQDLKNAAAVSASFPRESAAN
jgi:hypothetical protein